MKYKPKVVSYGLSVLTATATLVGAAGPLQALALAMLGGYAQAQESRPQIPDVEKPVEAAQDARPIAADKKPNVVFILGDNIGYGDLGSYGGGELRGAPTPRLDQVAQQGLRLTQVLVEPARTTAPAALITGQYFLPRGLSLVLGTRTLHTPFAPAF